MKILNWIVKIFNLAKDSIELIKTIAIIATIIISFMSMRGCVKEKELKINAVDILTSKVETFKTKSGLNATKAKNWQIKYKALDNLNGEISQENNAYLNELLEAKQIIKDLDIRLKDTKNVIKSDFIVQDSLKTKFIYVNCDKIKIEPIKTKHIKIDFDQTGEYLKIKYEYSANISTVISRYPKFKKNGEKHLLNWGFIWGWDYKTTSIINDPNAKISNLVEITFSK